MVTHAHGPTHKVPEPHTIDDRPGYYWRRCRHCGHRGWIYEGPGQSRKRPKVPCPACKGDGIQWIKLPVRTEATAPEVGRVGAPGQIPEGASVVRAVFREVAIEMTHADTLVAPTSTKDCYLVARGGRVVALGFMPDLAGGTRLHESSPVAAFLDRWVRSGACAYLLMHWATDIVERDGTGLRWYLVPWRAVRGEIVTPKHPAVAECRVGRVFL